MERSELQYELSRINPEIEKRPSYEDLTNDLTELRHIEDYERLKSPPVERSKIIKNLSKTSLKTNKITLNINVRIVAIV